MAVYDETAGWNGIDMLYVCRCWKQNRGIKAADKVLKSCLEILFYAFGKEFSSKMRQ